MKHENEPIAADELVVRLIWGQFFEKKSPSAVKERAFAPKDQETDGISVFRASCLTNPEDVLNVITPAKRDLYGVVLLTVADVTDLGLSVQPAPILELPGHAVIPELNIAAANNDRSVTSNLQQALARLANQNVIRRPVK